MFNSRWIIIITTQNSFIKAYVETLSTWASWPSTCLAIFNRSLLTLFFLLLVSRYRSHKISVYITRFRESPWCVSIWKVYVLPIGFVRCVANDNFVGSIDMLLSSWHKHTHWALRFSHTVFHFQFHLPIKRKVKT